MELYEDCIEEKTLTLTRKLLDDPLLKDFILVGGTALALRLGHRKSTDIDLFTVGNFDAERFRQNLQNKYLLQEASVLPNTLFLYIDDIKIDLISHPYPMQKPVVYNGRLRIASLEDIAAMKLLAIAQNGTRLKDFVDMYYLLEHLSLEEMTQTYEAKYPNTNVSMLRKALLYHKDINFDLKIKLLNEKLDWPRMTSRLIQAVNHPMRMFTGKTQRNKSRNGLKR